MQRLAAPPPGGPTPTQSLPLSLRARRPSIPAGGATKPASLTAEAALASLTARSSPNQDGASVHAGEKEQRRFVSSGSAPRSSLFTSQRSRYGSAEQAETIASLQQNVASLSAFNRREKAHNEALKAQIAELSSKCSQLQGEPCWRIQLCAPSNSRSLVGGQRRTPRKRPRTRRSQRSGDSVSSTATTMADCPTLVTLPQRRRQLLLSSSRLSLRCHTSGRCGRRSRVSLGGVGHGNLSLSTLGAVA